MKEHESLCDSANGTQPLEWCLFRIQHGRCCTLSVTNGPITAQDKDPALLFAYREQC